MTTADSPAQPLGAILVRLKCNCFRTSYFFQCNFCCQSIEVRKRKTDLTSSCLFSNSAFHSLTYTSVSSLFCLHCPLGFFISLVHLFALLFIVPPRALCLLLMLLCIILFLLSQSNVQPTKCVLTQRGWSWVQATLTTTPISRCAPGWLTWRRVTTSLCTLNSSRQKRNLTSWKYLMVGSAGI